MAALLEQGATLTEAKEIRNALRNLPERIKADVLNGMSLVELGYRAGYLDALSRQPRQEQTATV